MTPLRLAHAWIALTSIAAATAQVELTQSSFQGGGTTATGGSYSLTGTGGAYQSGAIAGGAYDHDGGFWPGVCSGQILSYGSGCPGSGGFTPSLTVTGCASSNDVASFAISQGLGGSQALFLVGFGQGATPIGGGCLLNVAALLPAPPLGPIPLFGAGPGAGAIAFTLPVLPGQSAPATIGLSFTLQAFVIDPGNVLGAAATNGVEMKMG